MTPHTIHSLFAPLTATYIVCHRSIEIAWLTTPVFTAGSTAMLRQRTGRVELMTTVREAPRPALHAPPEIDVEISWLLRQLSASDGATATAGASAGAAGAQAGAAGGPSATVLQVAYAIDRGHSACRTPRRNLQSEAALERARLLHAWATVR